MKTSRLDSRPNPAAEPARWMLCFLRPPGQARPGPHRLASRRTRRALAGHEQPKCARARTRKPRPAPQSHKPGLSLGRNPPHLALFRPGMIDASKEP